MSIGQIVCGFRWNAPFIPPPGTRGPRSVAQQCCLLRGHDGDHQSLSKVTAPNHPRMLGRDRR